ncbi:putative PLP-dependent transferase [Rosellinia necatrix]|uniref:Putative PLP-dependent transferase n=1 Tax=Rosellinia necatrix TaxID=77044 RepID=A0A1S8A8J2_ROSNE|nr:putative PLP-dependent transferase [Rosellinia necatrix]
MLESPEFLVTLSTKKQKTLKNHCRILTRFLDQHEIPYYANINAGVFVWVDLRRYLHSEVSRNAGSDLSLAQASPSQNQEMLREQEMRLFQNCLAGGVGISLGSSFSSEEIGWFRISFTVEERALHVGLQRLLTCLQAMEA